MPVMRTNRSVGIRLLSKLDLHRIDVPAPDAFERSQIVVGIALARFDAREVG